MAKNPIFKLWKHKMNFALFGRPKTKPVRTNFRDFWDCLEEESRVKSYFVIFRVIF